MAKKKVTRKSTRKVNAKKTVRVASPRSTSSKGFFQKHKNLKWMLPLFVVVVIALLVVHHFVDERSANEGEWHDAVKNMIHVDSDDLKGAVMTVTPTPADGSTITPLPTAVPTTSSTSGY